MGISCSTFKMMPNHNPDEIYKLTKETGIERTDLNKKSIILEMNGDLSVQPVGAYIDDRFHNFTNAVLTYVIPNAGHVLFESMADTLKENNARVYRKYNTDLDRGFNVPRGTKIVKVIVESLEFHLHREKDADEKDGASYILSRAKISYAITEMNSKKKATFKRITAMAKVSKKKNAFRILSSHLIKKISKDL